MQLNTPAAAKIVRMFCIRGSAGLERLITGRPTCLLGEYGPGRRFGRPEGAAA
jgi:hypothetical protein